MWRTSSFRTQPGVMNKPSKPGLLGRKNTNNLSTPISNENGSNGWRNGIEFIVNPKAKKGRWSEIEDALSANQRIPTTRNLKYQFPAWSDPPFKLARIELDQVAKWKERLRVGSRPTRRKLADYVKSFLETKLAQVKGGVRKPKTYGDLIERFKAFKQFVGTSTLDALDETLVRRYYNHLIGLGRICPGFAKGICSTLSEC